MGEAARQLFLLPDDKGTKYLLTNVAPDKCRLSRFNTRKQRNAEDVQKLAQRMELNGFEPTRALWAYKAEDGAYEVFAGGTRLEAAQKAGIAALYIWVHEGYSWEDISRLADQDNEDDSYHIPVRPMDVWTEYARLRDDEGWTQKRIAEAKKVHPTTVGERITWAALPDDIKAIVDSENTNGTLSEHHLRMVSTEIQALVDLQRWARIDEWRIDLLRKAAKQSPVKSSRKLGEDWQAIKNGVDRANALITQIPDGEVDEYADNFTVKKTNWRERFVDLLVSANAQSMSDVDRALTTLNQQMQRAKRNKEAYDNRLTTEQQQVQIEAERIEAITARWQQGDCRVLLPTLEDGSVRLLLTDPPYGVDFQSNRRVATPQADKILNDGDTVQAVAAFMEMLKAISDKMADEAHLLVFTDWQVEHKFMEMLSFAGYAVRGSLVWVKENHTSGDLTGSFAPRHERIIHATKGRPEVSPRIDDVLQYARPKDALHPTQKPVDLLAALIKSTSRHGDLVVDPFAGVGSTLVAAKTCERDFWGCELDKSYYDSGFERLKAA